MSSISNAQSTEVGHLGRQNACQDTGCHDESSLKPEEEKEEEEEDEEDIDFNPFLKETHSPEASSSLSSEIDGLNGDVVKNVGKASGNTVEINSSKPMDEMQNSVFGDSEHGEEETVMQAIVSPEEGCEKELQNSVARNPKKRKSAFNTQTRLDTVRTKGNDPRSDFDNDLLGGLSNTTQPQKSEIDLGNKDAICTRTRARYSLASFTLDELETFLQETDDDDDLQNVDDEEEYKKFLAAVLNGRDGDAQSCQENENVDDEDEDNDADFEIELEELLESDVDEFARDKTQKDEGAGRRPETRQNRRQKDSARNKRKFSGQANRPLRPLLPVLPNGPTLPFSANDGKTLTHVPSTAEDSLISGFTLHQIGQLHCLIHEHVQLLIQVFSLCVLDSSRQHVASQVQELIFEILHKRNEVLAWKNVPYPSVCFYPPYVGSSVPDEVPKFAPEEGTLESCPIFNSQRVCSSPTNQMVSSQNMFPFGGRCEHVSSGHVGSFQNTEGSFWVPFISGSVLSILDVAPLNLVEGYMTDVFAAVQDYQQRHVKSSCETPFEREPLFPLPCLPSSPDANCEALRGSMSSAVKTSSSCQQQPKKTLAAALVESTKKQSVALVPKEVAKLAHNFFPFFNPALFPHKPPPAAVVNRVLFTDAEDELLALGLMEYKSDWKAIQQRFLPCKSKHQIFVRQKNRCSSKAPENPIKAVRRMKTSPLSAEEIARIQEGLKAYKLDWMSVWRFVVPYRDPSLLPRQWRIALGTQRSYKQDAAKKEKRRLYELRRRKCKSAEDNQVENVVGENNSGDDSTDNAGEAYVHQAFLADWRPVTFALTSSVHPCSNLKENGLPSDSLPQTGIMHKFPLFSQNSQHPRISLPFTSARNYASVPMELNHPASGTTLNTSKSQFCSRPYRARRSSGASNSHLVKLAPDLPPVNLPPSVRIVSQTDFKGYQFLAATKASGAGGGIGNSRTGNLVSGNPHAVKLGTTHSVKSMPNRSCTPKDNVTQSLPVESEVVRDKSAPEERQTDSDLQMHPLLFQAPEDGHPRYYPFNCSTSNPTAFSFFPGNRPQLNLNLFQNPHLENYVECGYKSLKPRDCTSVSSGIDFHPLLQRTDDAYSESVTGCSTAHLSVGLGGKSALPRNSNDPVHPESLVRHGLVAGAHPPSSSRKANELDLEIHLSYNSRKDKCQETRPSACDPTMSVIASDCSGSTTRAQSIDGLSKEQNDDCQQVSMNLVSGGRGLATASKNISRYNTDDIGDNSHPEIVMEQEELSDSEEEAEEQVEFECEEMADSEGEDGSGCEQIVDTQDKGDQNVELENLVTGAASNDKQGEASACCLPEGDFHMVGADIVPSLELGLSNQGKDDASNFSWLSLDSCAPDRFLSTKAKHEESSSGDRPAKNSSSCRPTRSCKKKKPNTKDVTGQKHAPVVAQQLSLGPLAIPTMKKPRKRTCRTNTSLNIGLTFESSGSDAKDRLG